MSRILLPRPIDSPIGAAVKHLLPPLPYAYAALERSIDAHTMAIHHGKHHAIYVAQLNSALAPFPELQDRSAIWLLLNWRRLPAKIRAAVRNNAGGHVNHSLFWRAMAPTGPDAPAGALADAIVRDFGSIEAFKSRFVEVGKKHFGSGWVWLARTKLSGGRLEIFSTAGHESPLLQSHFPVLVNDLWEHAYYLKYQNRRADYLESWWAVVNWNEAARLYDASEHSSQDDWEAEGGRLAPATP